jgi:pimeloyl-ACP methyl ester carboxylesterase
MVHRIRIKVRDCLQGEETMKDLGRVHQIVGVAVARAGTIIAAVVAALRRATSAAGELTRDEFLDNITLTWLTNTGVSGARIYWENKFSYFNAKNHSVPTAVSVFPGEQYQAPRSWTERAYHKLIYYNKVDKGGHFAAWEEPQLFSEELRAAFRSLRQ